MTEILARLFDFVIERIVALAFWHVCGEDETGIVQRLGKYKRGLAPGLNWKWPIVERATVTSAALDSTELRAQTLTTEDGYQVTFRGIMTYQVSDARKYILGVEDAASVVNDVGACVVAEVAPMFTLAEIMEGSEFQKELLRRMRLRAKRWGVRVDSFGLVDRVKTRTYRIITGPVG